MTIITLLKLFLVPGLIGSVTLVGRRWGPAIAGWLSGFPIVAGPILYFIAWEHGPEFGSQAALGTMLAIPAVLCFNLAYAWTAVRRGWFVSLLLALLSYVLGALALVWLDLPAWAAITLCFLTLAVAPRLFPAVRPAPFKPKSSPFEMAYRMFAAALLVLGVTAFADQLGPRVSGLLAMFPIISIVLACFSHHYAGPEFAIKLLRSVVMGWISLAVFFALLFFLLPPIGVGLAFAVALGMAAIVHLTIKRRIIS